jgi:L-lactate dehydrogenase complex protein LldF
MLDGDWSSDVCSSDLWRNREWEKALNPAALRRGLGLWAFVAARPGLYRLAARASSMAMRVMGMGRGRIARLPFFASGWTKVRDMPAPEGATFMDQWKARGGR